SREDPFPTVVLEAMEAGLPVVAFAEAGGIGEILDSASGILVPYLDVKAMADAVRGLLVSRSMRTELGAHGRDRVRDLHVSHYVEFLVELLGKPPGAESQACDEIGVNGVKHQ